MPAATTHVMFAQDVRKHLPEDIKKKITDTNMFLLGSQGPDLLFFSRVSLLPGSVKEWGNKMHYEKQDRFIPFFEKYSREDPELRSYYFGFLCHYALDSLAHPLVCAAAHRFYEETGENEGVAHVTMEGEIDVWMLHQRGRTIESYDVFNYLKVTSAQRKKIGKMYHEMFKEVFNADVSERKLSDCCAETPFLTKVLYPDETKYKLFFKLEDLFKLGHKFSGMMLNNKSYSGVLNLEKKALPLVHDPEKTISSSFPELYGKAIYTAQHLIENGKEEDYMLNFSGEPAR